MTRTYQNHSYQREGETYINSVDLINNCTAFSCEELLFHPNGGGQPSDHGEVMVLGDTYRVSDLVKRKGDVLIVLEQKIPCHDEIVMGDDLTCFLDWERRYALMRLHTASHVFMSAVRKVIGDYEPRGIEIADDRSGCEIRFSSSQNLTDSRLDPVLGIAQEAILSNLNVEVRFYRNMDEARADNPYFRVDPNLKLKGKIRVIVIDGFDANPCGGTHVKSLSEIGPIEIQDIEHSPQVGECSIRFTVSN